MNNNPFNLTNKNIIVTGASSGIGRACAITLSHFGASVALVARDRKRLEETLSRMEGQRHIMLSQDLTQCDKIEPLIEEAYKSLGNFSGFIHAAGVDYMMPVAGLSLDDYENVFKVNLFAAIEFIRVMSKKKYMANEGASIVLIASVMGIVGQPARSIYGATKGALISLVKSLSLELAPKKIRVNAVSPAMVKTELFNKMKEKLGDSYIAEILKYHPLGFGAPEDVAYACAFLLSDASRWITGTNLIIDGGYSAH